MEWFIKMKLLIVTTTKFDLNGITNVVMNYYRAMDKSDMLIDFVVPNEVNESLKEEIKRNNGNIYTIYKRSKNPVKYFYKLMKIMKKNTYDIIHAHGNSATLAIEMFAAKRAKVPVRISHSHNSTNKYKRTHKLLKSFFEKNYTHALSCGEKAGEWLYGKKPFTIVKNGINVKKFTFNNIIRESYRKKMNLENKKVIGHIGRFTYQKNHSFLVEVFYELYQKNKDYRLLLIGDGDLRKKIEEQVEELKISDAVIFTGKRQDIPELMSVMDMFLFPSHFEGLPLTVVEAQTACLPCFISDRISEEVKITDLVQFISLEQSAKQWANLIDTSINVNRDEIKKTIFNQIISAGYSIEENAKKLKKTYEIYLKQEEDLI